MLKYFVCLVLITAAAGVLQDLSSCCKTEICPFPYNGYSYFFTSKRTYNEARLFCQSLGGDLASLGMRNMDMRQAIGNHIEAPGWSWIGLDDIDHEGCFQWVDGYGSANNDDGECADNDTAHWDTNNGRPDNAHGNEDCAEIHRDYSWYANDDNCNDDNENYGICEVPFYKCV